VRLFLGLDSVCCYLFESRLSVVDEFEIRFVGNQDRFVAAQFRADVKGRLVDFHDSSIRLAVSEAFWRALYFFKLFFRSVSAVGNSDALSRRSAVLLSCSVGSRYK
jgi:hypothetical protein